MTDAPQAEASQTARHPQTQAELLMANVEDCGNSIKAIIAGMSSTDLLRSFGPRLLEGSAFEGAREDLETSLQRVSAEQAGFAEAPQRATAPQTVLPRFEQSVNPEEGHISDHSSCASSLASYTGR